MTAANPQNPYRSFLVNASAGSGKTYQLSHRFLCLVASGAEPGSILTITFTTKAAKEMRQRILQLASRLLHRPGEAEEFDAKVASFYRQARSSLTQDDGEDGETEEPIEFRPPRSAQQTAREVLAWSQRLRITTIDAVFLQWQSRFAFEASEGQTPSQRLSIADEWQSAQLAAASFAKAFRQHHLEGAGEPSPLSPKELSSRIDVLGPLDSFLWLATNIHGGADPFGAVPEARYGEVADVSSYEAWLARHLGQIEELFTAIGGKKLAERIEAIRSGDVERLQTAPTKLLTKDGLISGAVVRGEKHKPQKEQINDSLQLYLDYARLKDLAAEQHSLAAVYQLFSHSYQRSKRDAGVLEFADAAKGCFTIFHHREYDSARFYLQQHISHIMIDEFQDTNLLQWSIFRELALEILAGYTPKEGEYQLKPSVFLVGDPKQSIYRFREAEAGLLSSVAAQLPEDALTEVLLAESYRSADTVLRFVNLFFTPKMADFPEHSPASIDDKPLIADISEVAVISPFILGAAPSGGSGTSEGSALELEAAWVAEDIAERLAAKTPVWQGRGKPCRPLRPSDIAVLTRTNAAIAAFSGALREQGIAASSAQSGGILDSAAGQDALMVAKALAFPLDECAWLALLKSPLVGIAEATIWNTLDDRGTKPRWSVARLRQLLEALLADLPELQRLLLKMASHPGSTPPSQVLSQLTAVPRERGTYHQRFGGEEAAVALRQLRRLIHAFSQIESRHGTEPAAVYHELLNQQRQNAIKAAGGPGQGVQVMTIHKSKGLEFALVYVTCTHSPWDRQDRYWLKSPEDAKVYYIGTKNTRPKADPHFERLMAAETSSEQAENLRLLYVAMTRASQYLVLTGHGCSLGRGAKPGSLGGGSLGRGSDAKASYHLGHAMQVAEGSDGFAPTTRHGQPGFVLKGRDCGAVAEPSDQPAQAASVELPPIAAVAKDTVFRRELKILAPSRLLAADDSGDDQPAHAQPLQAEKKPQQAQSPAQAQETTPEGLRWSAAEGTFIHACLEAYFLGDSRPVERLYPRYFTGKDQGHLEGLRAYWHRTITSNGFQALTAGADVVEPELPLCYIDGDNLINGSIDLLITRRDHQATIIDFKTTLAAADGDWRAHSLAESYHLQLAYYREGLRRLRPELTLTGGVFYTTPGLFVPLV